MEEKILYEDHPSMFRNHPVWFVLCLVLSLVLVGLVLLLYWWLQVLATKLTVTDHRTILRHGLLSKHVNEVYHSDIRNVQIRQTFLQRLLDVGVIAIASAGSGAAEIVVEGMRSPGKIKAILDQGRRESHTSE